MRRTLFMHIPKTAGTSVLTYMREVYRAHPRLELRWQDNSLHTVQGRDIAAAAYIWLHEPLDCLAYDTPGFFRFTFLRDPVERARSLYLYLRDPAEIDAQNFVDTPPEYVASLRAIEHMSFDEFVRSDDPVHAGQLGSLYARYFQASERAAFGSEADYLAHCLGRMETCFDYIGLTASLSEDMAAIGRACFPDYPTPFGDRRLNVSRKEHACTALSEAGENALQQRLGLDFAIYRHACTLRAQRFAALMA